MNSQVVWTHLAWVAETQHIPKKGLSFGLVLGWLLGDELWVFGIVSLIRMFLCAWGLGHIVSVGTGEHLFCSGDWNINSWGQTRSPCVPCNWPPIKTIDIRAWVSFHGWHHFTCIATHNFWENWVCPCNSTGGWHLEACAWVLLDFLCLCFFVLF